MALAKLVDTDRPPASRQEAEKIVLQLNEARLGSGNVVLNRSLVGFRPAVTPRGFGVECFIKRWAVIVLLVSFSASFLLGVSIFFSAQEGDFLEGERFAGTLVPFIIYLGVSLFFRAYLSRVASCAKGFLQNRS